MALAPFFEKAALAASHILQYFDLTTFSQMLDRHVVGVCFDDDGVVSPEGQMTLDLTVNMLARLYPRLSIVPSGNKAAAYVSHLTQLAKEINPNIEIVSNISDVSVAVVVGGNFISASIPAVYIGSSGWIVKLSPNEPVGSGMSQNPFGAGAAACFGAANIFRLIFGPSLPHGVPDGAFTLSLFNYETEINSIHNPDLQSIDIGETHLVGLGAIGNGAIWALSRIPTLSGVLHLVDKELIELTNVQRYVLSTISSEGKVKVGLAADQFGETQLQVVPHPQRWGEYLRCRNNWDLQKVMVALDSAQDRADVQASLPRWIVNAWTQPGDLGVSRHDFISDQACLMCLYLPEPNQKSEDELIAEAIGLPEAKLEVRELLYLGKPVGSEFIQRIANAAGIPAEPLLLYSDQPLKSFYSKAVCGGIILGLGGDYQKASRAEVPMAFQSALAGIMLAAELVVYASGLRKMELPTTTRIDLLRPLGNYLSFPAKKDLSKRCICQDPLYRSVYQEKYLAKK